MASAHASEMTLFPSPAENEVFAHPEDLSDASTPLSPPGLPGVPSLPPLTTAQAYHWREVCGVLSAAGSAGVADDQWPPDRTPSKPTQRLMVEYGLLVRRGRAWHLRRHWFTTLTALRLAAVDTPPLTPLERPAPGMPTYAELEAWETVCRWLDAQPRSRARLPFTGLRALGDVGSEEETPVALLRQMRHHRLVRHTSGCEWVLARAWQERLQRLYRGQAQAACEPTAAQVAPSVQAPVSLVAGIDTWVLNWKVEADALPQRLRIALDDLQTTARAEESEQDTPWVYDGAPLRMYRYGTKAESGGGVSWSYVLLNRSLRLVIRKAPLGGIIAQATLGSECLWRLTPLHALDQLHLQVRRMWSGQKGSWQVSQVHLAHDVMHLPIEREQLSCYISRSKKRAQFEAAQAEIARAQAVVRGTDAETTAADPDELPLVLDWDELYADEMDGEYVDPFDDAFGGVFGPGSMETIRSTQHAQAAQDALEAPVEVRASSTYAWGRRLSGVTWSPGGVISLVQYDKTLQGRLSGKRHMEALWRARGWDGVAGVTRNEARLRRPAIRELAHGLRSQVAAGTDASTAGDVPHLPDLDDPWVLLRYLRPLFGAVVGAVDEGCPDAVNSAWIRRVIPDAAELNRSRWDTDPAWRIVQAAPFDEPIAAPVRRLVRRTQRSQDVARLDGQAFGIFVSRTAALHPDGGQHDISKAVAEAYVALEAESRRPGKDFGELVRQRRKERGLPVPICDRILPSRSVRASVTPPPTEDTVNVSGASVDSAAAVDLQREHAAFRVQQALHCLEHAELSKQPMRALEALEEAYLCELSTLQTLVRCNNTGPERTDGTD